jgi:hypothetical protein
MREERRERRRRKFDPPGNISHWSIFKELLTDDQGERPTRPMFIETPLKKQITAMDLLFPAFLGLSLVLGPGLPCGRYARPSSNRDYDPFFTR